MKQENNLLINILDKQGVEGLIKFLSDLDNACNQYQKGLFEEYGEENVRRMYER